jgi:hypothetical protein
MGFHFLIFWTLLSSAMPPSSYCHKLNTKTDTYSKF